MNYTTVYVKKINKPTLKQNVIAIISVVMGDYGTSTQTDTTFFYG